MQPYLQQLCKHCFSNKPFVVRGTFSAAISDSFCSRRLFRYVVKLLPAAEFIKLGLLTGWSSAPRFVARFLGSLSGKIGGGPWLTSRLYKF